VSSVRGPGGGYKLTLGADGTPIAAIVRAVDEPLRATRCSQHDGAKGCMNKGERCLTHDLWESLSLEIETYLTNITLADVVAGRLKPGATDRTAAA
jgi:Rrf2 family iron-sulfur cluster assembly transcriptional regulator